MKNRHQIERLKSEFGDMPLLDYAGACDWLKAHPEAGPELLRLARNAGAVVYDHDTRLFHGCNIAPA